MPILALKLLELDPVEQEELAKILARHSTAQQVARRVKIILLVSVRKNHLSKPIRYLWAEHNKQYLQSHS